MASAGLSSSGRNKEPSLVGAQGDQGNERGDCGPAEDEPSDGDQALSPVVWALPGPIVVICCNVSDYHPGARCTVDAMTFARIWFPYGTMDAVGSDWRAVGLAAVLGLLGSLITFVPGVEVGWFMRRRRGLRHGLLSPTRRLRVVAVVLTVAFAGLAWDGYVRGRQYREWLRREPGLPRTVPACTLILFRLSASGDETEDLTVTCSPGVRSAETIALILADEPTSIRGHTPPISMRP